MTQTRQYLIPGYGYVDETGLRDYLIPGQAFLNESSITPDNTAGAATESNDTASASAQVLIAAAVVTAESADALSGSMQTHETRQFFVPGQGYVNETGVRDYLVPGAFYANESSPVPIGSSVASTEANDAASAAVQVLVAGSAAATESPDSLNAFTHGFAYGLTTEQGDSLSASVTAPTTFTLTSALPSGWNYTRADSVATYLDGTGTMQAAAVNGLRFDHDVSGAALGHLFEESRTNLCANFNMAPTDATGLSTTGTASVSLVSDSTVVAAANLGSVITGNVIQASGGASGGTVVIAGATGATGAYCTSLYARVTAGASASFGLTPSPNAGTISGSAYARFTADDQTSTAVTDTLVITLPAGVTIHFVLNQLEAGTFSTSVIKVAGASAKRFADFMQYTGLATAPWWNPAQGAMIASCNPYQANNQVSSAAIAVASSAGTFPTDAIYLQTNNVSNKPSAWGKASNASVNAAALTGVIPGRKNPVGVLYQNGGSIVCFAGAMVYGPYNSTVTMTGSAANIVNLTVGSFANGTGSFNGHIDSLTFFDAALTLKQVAPYCLGPLTGHSERAIIGGGQSNMANNCTAPPNSTNGGELALDAFLDAQWGTSTRNWVIAGAATGGTSFTAWQSSNNGAAIAKWKTIAAAYLAGGGTIEAILWDQGEADLGYTTAQFYAAYLGIFQDMQTYLHGLGCAANLPVLIRPLGRYRIDATETSNTNCGQLRAAQQQLAALNPSFICIAPEKSFEPLVDNLVHLTDAGYANHAPMMLNKLFKYQGYAISGGVDGPTIANATCVGTTVTVTLQHDVGGSDFTPTSGIGGFQFYDNGVQIALTSAVRTDPVTVTLTLASAPVSPLAQQQLRYAWGTIYNDDGSTLVRDNSAAQLPLRAAAVGISNASSVSVQEANDTLAATASAPAGVYTAAVEAPDSCAAVAFHPVVSTAIGVAFEQGDSCVAALAALTVAPTPANRILSAPSQSRLLQPASQNRIL